MNKCVVLLSGGLDSATTLYYAKSKGFKPTCLIFDYNQRHNKEIRQAIKIAKLAGCDYKIIKLNLPYQNSALLNKKLALPQRQRIDKKEIPSTYVPGRNIIFLSLAVSYAEAIGAQKVFIGANAIDYSGYPDCRPQFVLAFQKAINLGLKSGVKNKRIEISAPLIKKTKAEIIKLGLKLNVPYKLTWSCYQGGERPCGKCDSCQLRAKGFKVLGINDPA